VANKEHESRHEFEWTIIGPVTVAGEWEAVFRGGKGEADLVFPVQGFVIAESQMFKISGRGRRPYGNGPAKSIEPLIFVQIDGDIGSIELAADSSNFVGIRPKK
jgi:hypothetical protein